ncbi:redox-sensing transcriptional repressor Rex [Oxobacter pfennigii]|uniref:Redox-sensing transcriptional repressor Rex n=1 Tax=Oxobacter pfennigii TaxID=36849 RepID=A0A0P8WE66_9CLOT|nr:redox-sensing transcriptional repressor Rex [Oxobacter pfennigii]KPU46006.1 redox-sensing transcriptional repressor Rex [Oxobacter pfennigii]
MTDNEKINPPISIQTLKRLPLYLGYLKSLDKDEIKIISSPIIAKALNLNEVQVRKDLASIKSGGRPKTGYLLEKLIISLEEYLGYGNMNEAVLVGVGCLGCSLLKYNGFENYGMKILVGFDVDESVIGTEINGKRIFPISKLKDLCQRLHINIGIITVTGESAQEVCDLLLEAGIQAIWNFTSIQLNVPDGIIVQNENIASSLAVLSKHLKKKSKVRK